MENIVAIIENGIGANVVVADAGPGGVRVEHLDPRPGIGWAYDGENFTAPAEEEPEPVVSRVELTKLEFLRRFTAEERITARKSGDPVIEDAEILVNLADHINLTDEDTINYVHYLAHVNILEPFRVEEILKPIIQE